MHEVIDNVEFDNINTSFFIMSFKTFDPLAFTGNKFTLNLSRYDPISLTVLE